MASIRCDGSGSCSNGRTPTIAAVFDLGEKRAPVRMIANKLGHGCPCGILAEQYHGRYRCGALIATSANANFGLATLRRILHEHPMLPRLTACPPMHYLANWRMQVATQKLRNTSASLSQVAEIVGYDSRPHSPARSRKRSAWRQPGGGARTAN